MIYNYRKYIDQYVLLILKKFIYYNTFGCVAIETICKSSPKSTSHNSDMAWTLFVGILRPELSRGR